MGKYVLLTRISPEAFRYPTKFRQQSEELLAILKRDCPSVRWKHSYATVGRFDVVDVIEASDPKEVEKAAMIIRAYGHADTEVLSAVPWGDFLGSL
jgi:uncharacterized protein with GYD domain